MIKLSSLWLEGINGNVIFVEIVVITEVDLFFSYHSDLIFNWIFKILSCDSGSHKSECC